jgi:hypothetical protein
MRIWRIRNNEVVEKSEDILSVLVEANSADASGLGALHRSHDPEPGPNSISVHRPDAATVSYTEIECSRGTVSMGYVAGSPCEKAGLDAVISIPIQLQSSVSAGS